MGGAVCHRTGHAHEQVAGAVGRRLLRLLAVLREVCDDVPALRCT